MDWTAESKKATAHDSRINEDSQQKSVSPVPVSTLEDVLDQPMQHSESEPQRTETRDDGITEVRAQETKCGRPKKMKIMEVKAETQTSMTSKVDFSVDY